jgi:hypothetical protein
MLLVFSALRRVTAVHASTVAAILLVCGCTRSPTANVTGAERAATSPSAPAPIESVSVANATGAAASISTYPRWVPRVAPAAFARFGAIDVYADTFAPIRNNYGTDATVYLGNWRVGLIEQGRRFIFAAGQLNAVNGDRTTSGIQSVLPLHSGLGGGFLFSGPAGLYFADRFDGPLRKLASDAQLYLGVAPNSVLIGGEQPGFVSTADARPITGSPNADHVVTHRRGFAIAWSDASNQVWFTATSREWKELANEPIRSVLEDGDALLAFSDAAGFRVGFDGTLRRVTLTPEQRVEKQLASAAALVPEHWGPEDAYEGALIDAGWMRTGRSDDEWLGVHQGQLWLAHSRSRDLASLGPVPGDESCGAAWIAGQSLLLCFELGTRLSVFRVDIPTGRIALERKIQIHRGVARHLGATDTFPTTLMAAASCEGDAEAGLCVRGSDGSWTNHPPPPTLGRLLVFPTEVIALVPSVADAWELRVTGKPARVFSAAETRRFSETIGAVGKDAAEMRTTLAGVLRTATGLRMFHTSNPMKPVSGDGDSYALDLPFDRAKPASIEHVPGVVACAGTHGLRLAAGQLWETNDAWQTWRPVEPPPTGRTPRDLAAAMCSENGCVLGAWARIGWN